MTTPQWFLDAVQTPYAINSVDVDGCRIEYYQWEKIPLSATKKPLLLFVHGNGGHANWWDFIAPSFMDNFCVCALHLAGMGNSSYRKEYDFNNYAKDVIAVANAAGYHHDITIVGHSMGGIVTLRVAENYPEQIKAIIIVDSPMIFKLSDAASEQHKPPAPTHHSFKAKRYYPDYQTTFEHFHLMPAQECKNKFLVDHVAHYSIKQFPEGWSWKFDGGIYLNFNRSGKLPPFDLDKIHCRFAYIYGNDSALVPQRIIPDLKSLLKDKGPVYEIQGAHHHIMLDEPLQLIDKLTEILKAPPKSTL